LVEKAEEEGLVLIGSSAIRAGGGNHSLPEDAVKLAVVGRRLANGSNFLHGPDGPPSGKGVLGGIGCAKGDGVGMGREGRMVILQNGDGACKLSGDGGGEGGRVRDA